MLLAVLLVAVVQAGRQPIDCGAVIEFEVPTQCSSNDWRWQITSSYDGTGPTIHSLQFGNALGWIAPAKNWTASALSHSNGPAANLLDNTSSFWNADQTPAHPDEPPWTATISMPADGQISPTKFRYRLHLSANAPRAFELQCRRDIEWSVVLAVSGNAGCGSRCKCPFKPPPTPPAPPPPQPPDHTPIEIVHYVSSYHLDLGFAIPNGFSAGINDISWWPDSYHKRSKGYLFQAINTSRELRARGGEEQLRFLPPPYITSLGLDCPPNMSMHTNDPDDTVRCPTEEMKQTVIAAAKEGSLGLWGSPFNQQVEWMMDPQLIQQYYGP